MSLDGETWDDATPIRQYLEQSYFSFQIIQKLMEFEKIWISWKTTNQDLINYSESWVVSRNKIFSLNQ